MVMKRIRKGSGKGMQVITSNSRRIAKNVDTGAKVLEQDFGSVRQSGPSTTDAFGGGAAAAREAARQQTEKLSQGFAQSLGIGTKDRKIGGSLGDGLGTGNGRVVPRGVVPGPRMLEK